MDDYKLCHFQSPINLILILRSGAGNHEKSRGKRKVKEQLQWAQRKGERVKIVQETIN